VLKPKNGKNANEWVQCLSVLVAKKETTNTESSICNNVSLGKGLSISGLRSAVWFWFRNYPKTVISLSHQPSMFDVLLCNLYSKYICRC